MNKLKARAAFFFLFMEPTPFYIGLFMRIG